MQYEPIGQPMREPHYLGIRDGLPPIERHPVHIVLDNIRSAFNVGSIFRTADAGAVAHMHLCGMTAYPPNAKLTKTALGAFDYVPWTHYGATRDAIATLHSQNVICAAIEAVDSAVPHTELVWPRPVAIVFGNEVTGIGSDVMDLCDTVVKIPMQGYKNTINVATAFGVVLFEILRQWRAFSPPEQQGTDGSAR